MGLVWITGLSYHEINIIVYYGLIPLTWSFLYELPRKNFKITIIFLSFMIICVIGISFLTGFAEFSTWLFIRSQDFLNSIHFIANDNYNYIISSVVICVIVPAMIYFPLIKMNWQVIKKHWKILTIIIILLNLIIGFGSIRVLHEYYSYGR